MERPNEDATGGTATQVPAPPGAGPTVWSALGTVVLYFLLQLGIAIAIGAVIAFTAAFKAGLVAGFHHTKPDLQAIAQATQNNPDMRTIIVVASIAAATVVMTLIVRQTWPARWPQPDPPGFGLARARRGSDYLVAVLFGFALLFLGGALTKLLAHGQAVTQDVALMASDVSIPLRILLAVLVVCVAPFVEELVFRGVLLSGFARRMRIGWAIFASALVFGIVHMPDFQYAWYPVPALVLLGLALGWLRVHSGSLWPSVTLHATNNFVAVLAWILMPHHP